MDYEGFAAALENLLEEAANDGVFGSVTSYRDGGVMTTNMGFVVGYEGHDFHLTLAGSYDDQR